MPLTMDSMIPATCAIPEAMHWKVPSVAWVFSLKKNDESTVITISLPILYCKASTAKSPNCCAGSGETGHLERMQLAVGVVTSCLPTRKARALGACSPKCRELTICWKICKMTCTSLYNCTLRSHFQHFTKFWDFASVSLWKTFKRTIWLW